MRYKNTYAFLPLMIMMLSLQSCALFQVRDAETEARLLQDLNGWGRSGTIVILNEAYKGDDKKAERKEAAEKFMKVVNENVMPWLNDDTKQINALMYKALMNSFGSELDPLYRVLAKDAFDYLARHVEVPTADKILPKHNVYRLKSFFNGALQGAELVAQSASE